MLRHHHDRVAPPVSGRTASHCQSLTTTGRMAARAAAVARSAWRRYHETRSPDALCALDPRLLSDIGIDRSEITLISAGLRMTRRP